MTIEEWKDEFTTDLRALMALAGKGTLTIPASRSLVFGRYVVSFAAKKGDKRLRIGAMENVEAWGTAVNVMTWTAQSSDAPRPVAESVASWLRGRRIS